MYLNKILIRNIGPIGKFNYQFKFDSNGKPSPVIVIGSNGKGKTILSSYISDFFVEVAKVSYDNVVEKAGAFYRIIGGSNVKAGNDYGYTIISADDSNKKFYYYEKCGIIDELKEENEINAFDNSERIIRELTSSENNLKNTSFSEEDKIFENSVLASFVSYRSEKPSWMNDEAIKYNDEYSTNKRISRKLNREIIVEHSEELNDIWLERVISDSMTGITLKEYDGNIPTYNVDKNPDLLFMNKQILESIEKILSLILKNESKLILNSRNSVYRISIKSGNKYIPSIKHLSLGESILFNMFITILRHGDEVLNGNLSNISMIKGVVVIDEIDMHLDTDMQYKVLPNLISLFSGIQFIITSHSPLFLLGMNRKFSGKCDFIEMPDGIYVDIEKYDEFSKAYECLKDTNKFNEEINNKVNDFLSKRKGCDVPLIITEGSTDWKHISHAFEELKKEDEYSKMFERVNFEFLKYSSDQKDELNIQMGDRALLSVCQGLSILPNSRKIICIGDNDNKDIKKRLNDNGSYKKWGNNVFSFTLPVPQSRESTPNICIEHYYSDIEIKKSIKTSDGIYRRLYMGNEFNEDGFSLDGEMYCQNHSKLGNDKINILDGEDGSKIFKVSDMTSESRINYALSKSSFVECILNEKISISKKSYDNFALILNKICEIIDNN